MFQGFRHQGGDDGFLRREVIEQSPSGDPRSLCNVTGGGFVPALGHEESRGSLEDALAGGGFGFGGNPHGVCRAPKVSMLIK